MHDFSIPLCRDAEAHLSEQTSFLSELVSGLKMVEEKTTTMSGEYRQVHLDVDRQKATLQERELNLERLNKDIAMAKEREATLLEDRYNTCSFSLGECHWTYPTYLHTLCLPTLPRHLVPTTHRATLDLQTRHCSNEYRSQFETLSRKTKEKDKDLK